MPARGAFVAWGLRVPALDVAIIGGGITGAGLFREASRAGLSCLLLEKGGPGGRTTRASSGLLHGGLRYLPYDAPTSARSSREAGLLAEAYPALVRRQPFLWPVYESHRRGLELVETLLELYDRLSPLRRAFTHLRLSARQARAVEPGLRPEGLVGALSFDEWAVDGAGLVAAVVAEGEAAGGRALHGAAVVAVETAGAKVSRVRYDGGDVEARCVVNAAGPWADEVLALAGLRRKHLALRRGTHLVVPGAPARAALIFPDRSGRYVGLYPRPGEAWIGPTDEPLEGGADDARPEPEELERLEDAARAALPALPRASRGVCGVRPILAQTLPGPLSRDFRVFDHADEGIENLLTVAGGKLTLFRPMADETLAAVCRKLGRPAPVRARDALDGAAAHNRALSLGVSAGLLAFYRVKHALLSSPDQGAVDAEYASRYLA